MVLGVEVPERVADPVRRGKPRDDTGRRKGRGDRLLWGGGFGRADYESQDEQKHTVTRRASDHYPRSYMIDTGPSSARPLHLLLERKRHELEDRAREPPVFPVLVRHLARVREILLEDPLESPGGVDVVDRDVQLLVQCERAMVQVG